MSEEKQKTIQTQQADNTINIEFTPQELQVIVNLLDIAVRSRGLDVAGNAAVIHEKIKEAFSKK